MTHTDTAPMPFTHVLALDTATRTQALALMQGDTLMEHAQRRVQFNHGSSLLEHVSQLLKDQAMTLDQIDLIAVGLGPGSFTGLRVGLAIAKSLARAKSIPLVGVSTLAATAYPAALAHPDAVVCAAFDARRSEAYAGIYAAHAGAHTAPGTVLDDHTTTIGDLRARLIALASDRPVLLVGDAFERYADLKEWPTPNITALPQWAHVPSAIAVAQLARLKAQSGDLDDPARLEPNYIRPTEAEIKFGR